MSALSVSEANVTVTLGGNIKSEERREDEVESSNEEHRDWGIKGEKSDRDGRGDLGNQASCSRGI